MSKNTETGRPEADTAKGRRSLITGLGVAAAGIAVATTASAQDRGRQNSGFQPARHSADAWLDEGTGSHRVFVDSSTAEGGGNALLYSTNILNAHGNAYNGTDSDVDIVICFRHLSTPFGYGNAIWEKYGENIQQVIQFPPGPAPSVNPMNQAGNTSLPNAGLTVDSLVARGARVAICENATRFFSGQLAAAIDASPTDVFDELVAGAVSGSRFVSAGVVAATRSQEYGYSLLYAG